MLARMLLSSRLSVTHVWLWQVWGVAFDKSGKQLASVSDDKSLVTYSYTQ